jgi:hypothetical protein
VVKTFYGRVNHENKISVNYIPAEVKTYQVAFSDYSDYHGGNQTEPLWLSKELMNCESQTAVMDLFPLTAAASVAVNFIIQCPDGGVFENSQLPKEMRAQFSVAGKDTWRNLTSFTPETRKVKTYKLKIGESYDFRVSTDAGATWLHRQENDLIKNARWTFLIEAENYCN